MRKSKLALLVLVALIPLSTGCADNRSVPTELKAYTLEEALTLCETLPDQDVADCVAAAHSVSWGE